MSGLSLNIGLKALLSSRFVLDTVGHNLANANTPGYSRQVVGLSASQPLRSGGYQVGSGVDVARLERTVDDLLNRRIRSQRGVLGALDTRLSGLTELEAFLGSNETGSISGLLDGFFTSISDLATAPTDAILRTGLVQSSETLTSRFREVSGRLAVTARGAVDETRSRVGEVNAKANEIAILNVQIAEINSTGVSPNDLLDRRDSLVADLSELADVTTVDGLNGSVSVLVAGNTLVGSTRAVPMSLVRDTNGKVQIQLEGASGFVPVTGGSIGGLLSVIEEDVPRLASEFDDLANQLILSVNRLHSTGIPSTGSFTLLTSANRVEDFDGDGKAVDELLSNAGLPFDVTDGALFVNVENKSTGAVTTTKIEISASRTTVQAFIDELNSIDNIGAELDGSNRLRIAANSNYGFDFSKRLPESADTAGSFGGGAASVALPAGPYDLTSGEFLDLQTGSSPVRITFDSADFNEISQATAEEVAAVINAAATGGEFRAEAVGDTLVVQSGATGSTATLDVVGGTALGSGKLSFQVGSHTGSDNAVDPQIHGSYTGDSEGSFTFRPTGDGVIGTTQALEVEVLDSAGKRVALLDVGAGYVPGSELTVADGVTVNFSLGELSATEGDLFQIDLIPDSDTSDVLVAFGLNGFFTGSSAADIRVAAAIREDPGQVASSATGAAGDSQLLLDLLTVKDISQPGLGGDSIDQFYGTIVGGLGFETAATAGAFRAGDAVFQSLQNRRDQISGVDVDEELVNLVAFEQAFQAASRYINVVNQLSAELLNLI